MFKLFALRVQGKPVEEEAGEEAAEPVGRTPLEHHHHPRLHTPNVRITAPASTQSKYN